MFVPSSPQTAAPLSNAAYIADHYVLHVSAG
jgi:hypothetical protein